MNSNYFRLGETDFGIGKVSLSVDAARSLLSLEIVGSLILTQRAADDQTGPFNWVLYPPKLYFKAVPYSATEKALVVLVDENLLEEYDVALYLLEHSDVWGTLTLSTVTSSLVFEGVAQPAGEEWALTVQAEYPVR